MNASLSIRTTSKGSKAKLAYSVVIVSPEGTEETVAKIQCQGDAVLFGQMIANRPFPSEDWRVEVRN